MPVLDYDVVIATRNRAEALALSIPRLIAQSRPPSRLIVIDSSDNPAAVRAAVLASTEGWKGQVIFETSQPGLTRQRNRGLSHVGAPVVFFPDDDSLLYPETAEQMMAVYERDEDEAIAAVCAAESFELPDASQTLDGAYALSPKHRLESVTKRWRGRLERSLTVLKPALFLGRVLNAQHSQPDWLAEMNVVPVEYMTGFRMSFRTSVIRLTGFDESLVGYGLDEDVDASFSAMRSGLVVAALRARIYHHRFPGARSDFFTRGRMEVLNRAYVLLKHATGPCGSGALANAVWRRHRVFAMLKLLTLCPKIGHFDGRKHIAGVLDGQRRSSQLWHVPAPERPAICQVRSTDQTVAG